MKARYLAIWLPSTIGLIFGSFETVWGILVIIHPSDEYPLVFIILSISVLLLSILGLMVFLTIARRDEERLKRP